MYTIFSFVMVNTSTDILTFVVSKCNQKNTIISLDIHFFPPYNWYQRGINRYRKTKGDSEMYEIAWMEVNSKEHIVSKRKAFKTEAARERFIEKLFEKDSFLRIIAIR